MTFAFDLFCLTMYILFIIHIFTYIKRIFLLNICFHFLDFDSIYR
jgi:hypothetical protein